MELFIKMTIAAWNTQNARLNKLVNTLSNEQLATETAPGRNTGTYLFGHLIAVSDALLPIMGWGEKFYPELETIFLKNPDKSGLEQPSIETLKGYFTTINACIEQHIDTMQVADWFDRHTAVSAADFANEPHRNKLNIMINRTNHTSYHLGQMAYLASKADVG
ncbi:DinB family protein [Mucilaginibacter gracilis]|uniref:DinB family protein n=1 Tax=Mucilaginibacter gracilis TaxID=423350 RepID=A0A495J4B7_9SPHI|nr:DinB family protein [Mucilaginibacter gracilis]RKR83820.1 DinB family protein [Mucilaginibacter gracilis]